MGSKSDQEIAKELSDKAMREQPHGKVGRVKVRKDEAGSFVTEYYKEADSKKPFAQDRTRGLDPEFSRDVEAANRNRQREQAARINREMKDDGAEGFMKGGHVKKYRHGDMVKGYEGGGLAKGKKCPHRGTVRGTGAAIGGAKFTGVK